MSIGGGGTSAPSNGLFFTPPACRDITAVGPLDPATGKHPPVYVQEPAPWSAVRDAAHSYGVAAFALDPGSEPGGLTTLTVTYYDVTGVEGALSPSETFRLQRPRRDAPGSAGSRASLCRAAGRGRRGPAGIVASVSEPGSPSSTTDQLADAPGGSPVDAGAVGSGGPRGPRGPRGPSTSPMSATYRVVTIALLALVTIVAFESMAIATAMPVVARDLGAVRSYGLAFSLLLTAQLFATVVAGVWCDRAGPMPSLYAGQVLFGAGSLVAGAALSFPMLLLGRVLAGLGSGLVIVALNVVIGRVFPMAVRPKVFSWMSAAWVLPSLVGPPIAGWLATYSWRLVFFLVVPPVVVTFALIGSRRALLAGRGRPGADAQPQDRPAAQRRTAVLGVVVAGSAALLQWGSQHLSPLRPGPATLVLAGAAGIALVVPRLVPPGTLRMARGLPSVMVSRFTLAGSWAGGITFVPLMLVGTRHLAPTLAGAMLTVGSLGWSAGSFVQGKDRFRGKRGALISFGALGVGGGSALLAAMTAFGWPSAVVAVAETLSGLGMGLSMSSTSVLALGLSPQSEHGRASSALQLSDTLGSLLGIAVAGAVFAALHNPSGSDAHVFVLIWGGLAVVALAGVVSGQRTRT